MIAKGAALDVIEIDAASNTGVDNIRELIERSQFAPVQCRYKVYVVDECHMLSTAAFNALLKTLEEPPDRVVFVLATTDPQRVLPTIISRCQRFDFRRIPLEAMVTHLGQIAEKEAIDITPEAVQLVAQISQGGLRDAEALLDQLSLLEGSITVERVWDLVGAVPERDLFALVQAIAQDDVTSVLDRARHLMDRGREPLIVLQNLASFYRDLLIAKTSPDRQDLVAITPMTWEALCEFVQNLEIGTILRGQQHLREAEIQVRNTAQPRLWLEVTLMGLLPSAIGVQAGSVAVTQTRSASPRQSVSSPSVPSAPRPAQSAQAAQPAQATQPTPAKRNINESVPKREKLPSPEVVEPSIAEVILPDEQIQQAEEIEAAETAEISSIEENLDQYQDLEQIWQEAIHQIQFRGTQVLLQQQGSLLFFDGHEARVGIKSQPLFKMAKEKLSTIEAAFEAVYQRKVRVSLEVTTAAEVQTPLLDSPPTGFPSNPPNPPTNPSTVPNLPTNGARSQPTPGQSPTGQSPTGQSPSVKESSASPVSRSKTNAPKPYRPTSPPAPPSSPTLPSERVETPASAPIPWQAEDEVSGAAKSLAQFFNGQIVSFEDDLPVSKIEETALDSSEVDGDDRDEDDVPF
jgi:DNA polymerase-3 subunit gamma/tau